VQGREAIVAMLSDSAWRPRPSTEPFFIRHFITNVRFVSVTPELVQSTAYFLVLTPDGPDHWAATATAWHRLMTAGCSPTASWRSTPRHPPRASLICSEAFAS
jgi:hypothetical protein